MLSILKSLHAALALGMYVSNVDKSTNALTSSCGIKGISMKLPDSNAYVGRTFLEREIWIGMY